MEYISEQYLNEFMPIKKLIKSGRATQKLTGVKKSADFLTKTERDRVKDRFGLNNLFGKPKLELPSSQYKSGMKVASRWDKDVGKIDRDTQLSKFDKISQRAEKGLEKTKAKQKEYKKQVGKDLLKVGAGAGAIAGAGMIGAHLIKKKKIKDLEKKIEQKKKDGANSYELTKYEVELRRLKNK